MTTSTINAITTTLWQLLLAAVILTAALEVGCSVLRALIVVLN